MTRDQVVDAIMRRLGNRTDTQNTLRNNIIKEIAHAQENVLELQPELPWFLLEEITSMVTVANQEYADLDSNHLAFWEETGGFWRQNSDGSETQLIIDDWDVIKAKYVNTTVVTDLYNAPRYGCILGARLYMRPIPDAVYTIKYWQYSKADTTGLNGTYGDGNASATTLWTVNAAEWLIGEVGAIVAAEIVRDEKAAANFTVQAQRGKKLVMDKSARREEELKTRIFGEV